ncbi:MBL fold metallo-hydrolase [bacterium]|nr:MBL fold metallo-hydrolase [bacterium]
MGSSPSSDFYGYMKNKISINDTNYYLLEGKDGHLLIDAGWVGKYSKFKKSLSKLNIKVDSIKYIFLTHHHHDHAALIQDIREESRCKLILHETQINFLKKGITQIENTKQYNIYLKLLDKVLSSFIHYSYKPIILNESDIIINIDNYDIYNHTGIKGKIIHTPGHSKDSISLLLENGDTFIGDVAMNILKVFGQKYRPVEAENYSEVYKSWDKLIRYGAKTIYPSHGDSFPIRELQKILKTT